MIILIVLFLLALKGICQELNDEEDYHRQVHEFQDIPGNWVTEGNVATPNLKPIDDLPNLAKLNDAQFRGPKWYDDTSKSDSTEMASSDDGSESELESSFDAVSEESSSASSFEPSEKKVARRLFRECTPCPHEMMKSYKNIGIKWICGGYQRARRSFKSECMMRYRNCEDGTMFVKLYNHRCKNSTFHGHHWFYVYRT